MRFDHDGVGIEWSVDHAGPGRALLLLHGLSGSMRTYDDVVALLVPRPETFARSREATNPIDGGPGHDVAGQTLEEAALADAGREVFRLDLRGHGQSDRAPGTYQVPHYSGDVVAFIEQVVGRAVVLAGHSLGGVIGHHVAATRPDLVAGALLEDPPLYFCDQSLFDASMFSQVFPIIENQTRELQQRGAPFEEVRAIVADTEMPWGRAADTMFPNAIDEEARAMMAVDPDVWGPAIRGGALSGYYPDAEIVCPLTILRADPAMGPALFPDHALRQQRANPHADIRLIEGAPHGIHTHVAARDRYMAALRDVIEKAGSA